MQNRRLVLSYEQRTELERLSVFLGISLQQAYRRLRDGSISLSSI